ncbi:MAG: hypothetical protein JWN17_1705 [Frankiales bacterium]|nr:hypothetical protein [Frankiales bacterium]
MRSPALRSTLLSTALVACALTLSACGDSPADKAPPAAKAVPSAVSKAVNSDVGQFLVKPKAGATKAQIDGTVAKLKETEGVEAASLNSDGFVDVTIKPEIAKAKRAAIVEQMAGLGEVIEGI